MFGRQRKEVYADKPQAFVGRAGDMSCGRTMPGNLKGEPTPYGGESTKADLVIQQTSPPIGTSTANAARIPRVLGMQRVSITLALKLPRRSKRHVLTLQLQDTV
jgi:hypothetical protein